MSPLIRPYLSVMLSAMIYGVCPTLMKVTYAFGGSGVYSAFLTCLISLPLLAMWARGIRAPLRVSGQDLRKIAVLLLGACPTSVFLYTSYSYIPVGLATTIHFIFPCVIALYLRVFWHERLKREQIIALALVFAGLFVLGFQAIGGGGLAGILLAALSGFTWAFYMVYIQKSGLTRLPLPVLNFYISFGNVVCSGFLCLAGGKMVLFRTPFLWLVVVFTALIHRVAANALYQWGMRALPPLSVGILSTLEPLTSILVGTLVLGEGLTAKQASGVVLILSGIVYHMIGTRRTRAKEKPNGRAREGHRFLPGRH